MTTWTYAATDLISGQVLADTIPLDVQSFSVSLNGTGTLNGSLTLSKDYGVNAPFVTALECRRAVLWVLADGYPVWAGVVWDWPHQSTQQGTLPISAQTLDSVWQHRVISDTIEYPAVDLFTAFLDLVSYGQTKMSTYISPVSPAASRPPGLLARMASGGKVARLVLPSVTAGVPWTASYSYSDYSQIASAWNDMTASGNMEWVFTAGRDSSGDLAVTVLLGYQQLGRPLADSGIVLTYPGNVVDYGYPRTGSQGSNAVWATAPPNGNNVTWISAFPHGWDLSDLSSGYPVMESTISWQGSNVTSQGQINSFADGYVSMLTGAMTAPVVVIGGGAYPALKDIILGDAAYLSFTSPLHPPQPDGSPGLQQEVRITGWTVTPSGPNQSESIQISTSAVTATV